MQTEAIESLALKAGFTQVHRLNMKALIPMEEVRQMCQADRCKNFGASWSCPPACGSLEEMREKLSSYSSGILVQTTGQMADPFDMEVIRETEKRHKKSFDQLARQTERLEKDCLPLGAGACTRCHKCTYPDRACRYPDKLYPSMEACGLWVSDVCIKSGLEYNYGNNTITYTSCILFGKVR